MKILLLTRYGDLGASSRMRSLIYLPYLKDAGIDVSIQILLPNNLLQQRYEKGRYSILALLRYYTRRIFELTKRSEFDLIWIEAEALPFFPLWMELKLLRGVPFVLDYDDAMFHKYDLHRIKLVRRFFGTRLDGLMKRSSLVMCGNNYLAERAVAAGADAVQFMPTVIDLDRYAARVWRVEDKCSGWIADLPRIVWIGSPTTVRYLSLLIEPLRRLATTNQFIFRVIGGSVNIPGVRVEPLPWNFDSEALDIRDCDIGVMPLFDSPWERGKCGYKIIQYMACALPVVVSDIGVNSEIVTDGINGYIARTDEEWIDSLKKLLESELLRAQMGGLGRRRVEQRYCVQRTAPQLVNLLRRAAEVA